MSMKLQSTLLVLSVLFCLTLGWEPGFQYEYKYSGRSVAGIHKLKQQNAIVELQSNIIVQSIDQSTIVVKLIDGRIKRTGNFLKNPFFDGNNGHPEGIEGEDDKIFDQRVLGAPFSISHNKGSITGVKIDAEEPQWIVNYKKSIASQLQLDITGVRSEDRHAVRRIADSVEGESNTFSVYEDSATGDCSTTIAISPLRRSQVIATDAFKLEAFDVVCQDKPVWQIVKTKDFNKCKTSPVWQSTTSDVYTCDFDKVNCGDFMKRSSVYKYVACGDLPMLTVVQASGFSDLVAQPFAIKSEELVNFVVTHWSLQKKEHVSSRLSLSSSPKEHKSLSYIHEDFNQMSQDGTPIKPNLSSAYYKSPVPVSTLKQNILNSLRAVERDLKDRPDAEKDNMERLAIISSALPMFSLDELRSLWQDIKSQSVVIQTLFVDCAVVAGSNPTVMLIKELIESEQLTGHKANFALSALGYYVKTPTHELLHELINLLKSSPVQSSKTAVHIALMTVADLLNKACGSRFSASKRFPVAVIGDFCDKKDDVLIHEFLPLLTRELETSNEVFDRIVALSAFGSLGVEEIVPILLPVIRGTGEFDDTAERVRAILSLHRVVFTAPEKIHPILASLAANVGERPEVRMASIGMLFMSNASQPIWQKLVGSTWFESNNQVASFVNSLVNSLARAPASTPLFEHISQKARVVLPNVKPTPFGLPFSMADIQSSYLDEGLTVMMHTITYRDSDQSWPVYLSNAYYYQLGPLNRIPTTVSMWNFNMADVWQNIWGKLFSGINPKYSALWNEKKSDSKSGILKGIWDDLNVSAKPADKRAGLLHINLLGSVNRFINLEKIEEMIPNFMAESMQYNNQPYEVSITKYRMLGEYNVRFATDLGLPMRYLFTLPMLVSMQGDVKIVGESSCKSDISAQLSWKMTAEIRVDIPFNGNYIATGVDVLVETNAPKELTYDYTQNDFKVTWTPSNKVTDLFHYHVKPYTVTRKGGEIVKPTLEDESINIIKVTDKPIQREVPLGDFLGVNFRLIEESELARSDKMSWAQYLAKWDINSLSNMGFAPLEIRNRKYVLRYNPSGTRARSISTAFFYQYAAKADRNALVYESGSSHPKKLTSPDIVSYKPIVAEFRPLLGRMFENLPSGNARLMRASLTAEQKDGSSTTLKSVVGMAMNDRYTKDLTDWQVEYSTAAPNNDKKTNFAICYIATRNWNNPPTYGFSKDVLQLTEEDNIGFGPECEHKVKFVAKVYRDEYAAKIAIKSPAGQQCLKDMESGFKYGSPACTEARRLDHTYNNYELVSEAENMSDSWLQWARGTTTWMNHILQPFIVKHVHEQKNTKNRASWFIKRDPYTGDSNMTFVRPHETVVAENVRWGTEWKRFSPLTFALAQVYYPLNAGSNFVIDTLNVTSAGVSESKCYVGSDAVHTFDQAHYSYTFDGCQHVLLTDCHKKSEFAILAKKGSSGQKIVTAIYGKDIVEMDPLGYVIVNGVRTALKEVEKGNHIEIRSPGSKSITVVIFPLADGGIMIDFRSIQFYMKVQGSHVELSAPVHLRGRTCGLCGDFNQEIEDDFKTPERCTVSSGQLMATSFKLKSDGDCSASIGSVERRLRKETESCESIDKQFRTYLPDYVL